MKIAIVNQPFDGILPPEQNSIGIWSYQVARRLAARHDVTVYGGRWRIRQGARSTRPVETVQYRFVFAAPRRVWELLSRCWGRVRGPRRPIYASTWYYLEYSLLVAIRIRRAQPDVVHLHNMTGFIGPIRWLNPRATLVLHMSCEWLTQLDRFRIERRLSNVDAVVGVSDHITQLVRRRFPAHADRCHTVYNGVDLDTFARPVSSDDQHGRSVVFVGRVSPEKGVHDLLTAWREVSSQVSDVRLDIVGPVGALPRSYILDVSDDPMVVDLARLYLHDYGQVLQELADRCPAGSVVFHGGQPHQQVVRAVAAAEVLVNPSYSESFGMSLVEALACSTTVVATRVGGMPEIVRDDAGMLVPVGDEHALASALIALLEDRALRERMGAIGRRRVEAEFSWDRITSTVEDLYEDLSGAA